MTPNFFVVDYKISAKEMGQIDDGEISFGSDTKEKHNSYLQSPLNLDKGEKIEHISIWCEADKMGG